MTDIYCYLWYEPVLELPKPTPVPLLAVHVEATLLDHCARVEIRQTFANQEDTPIEATYQFPLEEANSVCELHAEIDGRYLWYEPVLELPKPTPVPLLAVHVEATLLDHCARVEIRQTFANQEDTPIEATYQFPLEEANSVCELHAEIDGRKVTGVCKRKEDALNDNDDAIASGHGAYTLNQDDKDMLQLAVGNLPPKAVVVVTVVYVTELKFHNGATEWILRSNSRTQSNFFKTKVAYNIPDISIHASLDMSNNIESVACPSHTIEYTAGEIPGEGSAKLVLADASQTRQLDKDFVLLVHLAESSGSLARLEENDNGKLCAMVAVQPKLEWPEGVKLNSEIVVIVDRSASMAGKRIAQVRDSLQLLIRSLPEGVLFNIAGFGSRVDFLFKDGSVEYTPESFQRATKYVSEMKANLGGTDVLKVLEKVAQSQPKPGQLRQILLLTDGEVFNTSECVAFVLQQSRHTRVFTFGIGADASEELVRGLADAGNGVAEFVTADQPLMDAKIVRQLERVLQPALSDLQLDWGSAAVEQVTPAQLKPLFSGERLTVYAFLADDNKDEACNVEVTLRGSLCAQPWETKMKLPKRPRKGATLHALTAKQLIKELEVADDLVDHEEDIITLSETYSVLSRYTTFVAVEERDEATEGTMQLRKVEATSVAQAADAIGLEVMIEYSTLASIPRLEAQNDLISCRPFSQKSKKAKGGLGLPRLGLPSWASFATPAPQHQGTRLHHEAEAGISALLPRSASVSPSPAPPTSPSASASAPNAERNEKDSSSIAAADQKRAAREKRKVQGQLMKALEEEVISKKLDERRHSRRRESQHHYQHADARGVPESAGAGTLNMNQKNSDKGKERRDEFEDDEEASGSTVPVQKESGKDKPKAKAKAMAQADGGRSDTALPGPPPPEMRALVLAQRFDGSWTAEDLLPLLPPALSEKEFKDALARALPDAGGKKRSKSTGGKSPRKGTVDVAPSAVWATAVALALLRTLYASQQLNWHLLAQKSEKWLQREAKKASATTDDLLAQASRLVQKLSPA